MSDDPLGPELKNRLRAELDRVQPRFSSPRYLTSPARHIEWRFAPAVLIASVISMLALTAYVATGSPNPADWGHDVVTVISSSSTTPSPAPVVRPTPTHKPEPKPTERPPEHESPEPAEDHSGKDSSDNSGRGSSDSGPLQRS